jgi:hypothetical protein
LEHVQLLCSSTNMRHNLHAGRAGSDNAHALVRELAEVPRLGAAGVFVVPSTRMEGMALERTQTRKIGELGFCIQALLPESQSEK